MPLSIRYEDHEKLLREVEQQAQQQSQPQTSATSAAGRVKTFLDVPRPADLPQVKTEWLVPDLIAKNSVTMVAGESGVGKTWFALCLALAISFGREFLGRRCRTAPVLYLDRENHWAVVRERLVLLGALPDVGRPAAVPMPDTFRYWGLGHSDCPPLLGDDRLLQMAREVQPLLVVDSLIRFHDQDENSATAMSAVMNAMKILANAGASVVVLHHKPKNSGAHYRGSSDIKAAVEALFSLSRDPDSKLLHLTCSKGRGEPLDRLWLRADFAASGGYVLADPGAEAQRAQREENAAHAEALLACIAAEPGITQRRLLERSGVPQKRARALLDEFCGKLWRTEPGPRDALCYFPASPAPAE